MTGRTPTPGIRWTACIRRGRPVTVARHAGRILLTIPPDDPRRPWRWMVVRPGTWYDANEDWQAVDAAMSAEHHGTAGSWYAARIRAAGALSVDPADDPA